MIHDLTTPRAHNFLTLTKRLSNTRWRAVGMLEQHASDGDTITMHNGLAPVSYVMNAVCCEEGLCECEIEII